MKFMLLSVFLDYSCSNSTCNLPFLFNHTKTRYCYKFDLDLCKAFKADIIEAIANILFYNHDDFYPDYVGFDVEDYQKEVKKMIEEKCEILSGALGCAYKRQIGMVPPWITSK